MILLNQALIIKFLSQVSIFIFVPAFSGFHPCLEMLQSGRCFSFNLLDNLYFQGNQNVTALNYSSLLGANKSGGGSLLTGAQVTGGLASWQEVLPDPDAGIII